MPASLTEGLPREVAAKFQRLQQRFVAGLPERWRAITQAGSDAALHNAELHRLAGSAGSYGFEHLSRCARAAEQLQSADSSADLALVMAQLAQAIAQAQAAISEPEQTAS